MTDCDDGEFLQNSFESEDSPTPTMSYQRLEDPGIPLVGLYSNNRGKLERNDTIKQRTLYTINAFNTNGGRATAGGRPRSRPPSRANSITQKPNPKFENVGIRLALRKELYMKRKRTCDASLTVAVAGIILMVIETELCAAGTITRADPASVIMKICNSAMTVILIGLTFLYYKLGVQLFTCNNSVDDWRLALRPNRIITFLTEVVVCIVHPIPGEYFVSWYTTESDGNLSDAPVKVPLDVLLSLPMFLRLYLVCRYLMLHSRLYKDASCQSLGALNRINLNFRFVFKSFMALYPDYFLTVFMVSLFIVTTWCLRLCEMYNDALEARVHGNLLNNMWLVAITFLTVGYGDIVPNSFCGRGIAVITGILGTGCTALIVAILARKLELSRAEKYVHNYVFECEMGNQQKIEAANIIKNAWKLFKLDSIEKKTTQNERMTLKCQTKLLYAIYNTRELRDRRRRLNDNSVTLVEVNKTQSEMHKAVRAIDIRQTVIEEKVIRMEAMLSQLHEMVCGPISGHGGGEDKYLEVSKRL